MDLKKGALIIFNFLLYIFAFLLLFFIIYRAYIYSFDLKPHPCIKCMKEKENKKTL